MLKCLKCTNVCSINEIHECQICNHFVCCSCLEKCGRTHVFTCKIKGKFCNKYSPLTEDSIEYCNSCGIMKCNRCKCSNC
jgi:hypothetical protein